MSLPPCHVPYTQFPIPNTNQMSDFTCQCTDTMLATCTSSFASAYVCAAIVAIAIALARVCTCDWDDTLITKLKGELEPHERRGDARGHQADGHTYPTPCRVIAVTLCD